MIAEIAICVALSTQAINHNDRMTIKVSTHPISGEMLHTVSIMSH